MKFVDEAVIHTKAGDGGRGAVSFRRERFVPKGGPDGGDGGKGGDVIIIGNSSLTSLVDFKYKRKYTAENGKSGAGRNKTGRNGVDVRIEVPLGTIIYDVTAGNSFMIADITKNEEVFTVSRGGRGGRGNARFVTSTNRVPLQYDPGEEGEEKNLRLVLKLLADVGIAGLPNAGKSTLIAKLTDAKPKIGDYPFTTLTPNLGVYGRGDITLVLADIPGIIEGAHEGKGLGLTFLRHIERTGTVLLVLDISLPSMKDDYSVLLDEMREYGNGLPEKKRVIVLNKIDLVSLDTLKKEIAFFQKTGETVFPVSAKTGDGIEALEGWITDEGKTGSEYA